MKIIHGETATYYAQWNNKESPDRACGVTSAINAVVALGHRLPACEGQPEDALMRFIRADPVCIRMYEDDQRRKTAPINEWQDILAAGLSRWMRLPELAWFVERATAAQIFAHVKHGGAGLVTGEFPSYTGRMWHHTIALIGLETVGGDDLASLIRWYVRDSQGDHRTLYSSKAGNLIDLKPEEFTERLKTTGRDSKWCIFIRGK